MKTMFIAASLALVGCAGSPTGESNPLQGPQRQVGFRCGTGEMLTVRFFPARGTAVLTRHGLSMEMQQQPSGSGFVYSNGANTLRGKGDDLTVEIGRMVPLQCRAVN